MSQKIQFPTAGENCKIGAYPNHVLSFGSKRENQRKLPLLPRRGARKGFPLRGKLSPQVTDEGELPKTSPLIRRAGAPPSPPREKAFPPGSPRHKNVSARRTHQIYYLLFLIYYFSTAHMQNKPPVPPKQTPPSAENRQTGANQTYFTSSFGSKMFSKIATMAAGTMPEPPNTRRTASGVWARIPVLAPMP